MRIRVLATVLLAGITTLTLSLIRGQERTVPASVPRVMPKVSATPVESVAKAPRDLSNLDKFQKQTLFSAQRGADWMFRMHGVKGRFVNGFVPALKVSIEGDFFPRQAAAAFALARAARFTGEERYAVRATQAVLALLEDTVIDESDSTCRHTALPSNLLNRLGSAGLLVMAINELPKPEKDLLEKSEQLCHFIKKQARPDGSLAYHSGKGETTGINEYPGAALFGLMLSQRHRPEPWKSDLVKKALPYYRAWWKDHHSPAFVASMSPAFAEAHAKTKDKACAEFVCEMNDWLCTLQYTRLEPRRLLWHGGFMQSENGRTVESAPTVESATHAVALAEACRVTRELADVSRNDRYSQALDASIRFLQTLQYTVETTNHYADWYRPRLTGAFHHSHEDGNLRIDHTAQAVTAMVTYLDQVVR